MTLIAQKSIQKIYKIEKKYIKYFAIISGRFINIFKRSNVTHLKYFIKILSKNIVKYF